MALMDSVTFMLTLVFYCFAVAVYGGALVFSKEKFWRAGTWILAAGLLVHGIAIGHRWLLTGHIPTIGNYESTLVFSFFMASFTLLFVWRYPALTAAGLFSIPVAIITMGFGLMSSSDVSPMVVSLQSSWLYIHIFFAWLVLGATTFAFACSILYLMKEKRGREGEVAGFLKKIPELEEIDVFIYRNVVYGFIAYAVMIASGSLWAKNLWGAYWSWDPVETWSLISWLIYGVILHVRFTFGWTGRRSAWMVILALPTVFLVMFGINFAVESSKHIFNVQ